MLWVILRSPSQSACNIHFCGELKIISSFWLKNSVLSRAVPDFFRLLLPSVKASHMVYCYFQENSNFLNENELPHVNICVQGICKVESSK